MAKKEYLILSEYEVNGYGRLADNLEDAYNKAKDLAKRNPTTKYFIMRAEEYALCEISPATFYTPNYLVEHKEEESQYIADYYFANRLYSFPVNSEAYQGESNTVAWVNEAAEVASREARTNNRVVREGESFPSQEAQEEMARHQRMLAEQVMMDAAIFGTASTPSMEGHFNE